MEKEGAELFLKELEKYYKNLDTKAEQAEGVL